MKFEKCGNNIYKITVNIEDLKKYDFNERYVHDYRYMGEICHKIVDDAICEFNLNLDVVSVDVEIRRYDDGKLELNIIVDCNQRQDAFLDFLSNFLGLKSCNLERRKSVNCKYSVYRFNKLDDIIDMCSVMKDVDYKVCSSLYKMDEKYYIVCSNENNNNLTFNFVTEFGGVEQNSNDLTDSYYKEHGEIYITDNAFEKLHYLGTTERNDNYDSGE